MKNRTWVVLQWFGRQAIELHRDESWAGANAWAGTNGPAEGLITIDDGEIWDRSDDKLPGSGQVTSSAFASATG